MKPFSAPIVEPNIDIALVEWLEKLYPPIEAVPSAPHLDLVYHAGRRDVILFLRNRALQQQRKIEEGKE